MTDTTTLTHQLEKNLQYAQPGLVDTLKQLHMGGMDHATLLKACEKLGCQLGSAKHARIASLLRGWKYGHKEKKEN